jgi:hypothetical protein
VKSRAGRGFKSTPVHSPPFLSSTCAVAKGSTLKGLEQELSKKGYRNLLSVSKRGVKPSKTDFSEALTEIAKCVETFSRQPVT